MKTVKYLIVALLLVSFASCEREYDDVAKVTYFANITITGDKIVFVPLGADYADEGATATESDESIDVEVKSTVDTSKEGSYSVSYTAKNSDDFKKTVSRTVNVYLPNGIGTDLSGTYIADVARTPGESFTENPVTLTSAGVNGLYFISDWIGGFYDKGRKFGSGYSFTGVIQILDDNSVVEISMKNPWNDPFDSVVGTYNPTTHTISYSAKWLSTYDFVVNMVKSNE